jgi:tRNA A37 threonylcarbamoyltransferase TsaD
MIKMNYYSEKYKIKNIAIGGGVSANSLLREEISKNKR